MNTAAAAHDAGENAGTRTEHDLLGDRQVAAKSYCGVHTLRATENFPISGIAISAYPDLVVALACVKQAAARANAELGLLPREIATAIESACGEVRAGDLLEEFVVDVIQGGAGTSTNMNANEVIANRALELLGRSRGDYATVHPLEHVNMSQSTNDVYPTAVKVALQYAVRRLHAAMTTLSGAFAAKADEFCDVLKMGRTQLQDAVPMTLGQEFGTYAVMLGEDAERLLEASTLINEINLGGTAIGTGINAHPHYAILACTHCGRSPASRSDNCITGITANTEHLRGIVERSIGIVTALNPHIGYVAATELAVQALETDRTIPDLVTERGLLTRAQVEEILRPQHLIPTLRAKQSPARDV